MKKKEIPLTPAQLEFSVRLKKIIYQSTPYARFPTTITRQAFEELFSLFSAENIDQMRLGQSLEAHGHGSNWPVIIATILIVNYIRPVDEEEIIGDKYSEDLYYRLVKILDLLELNATDDIDNHRPSARFLMKTIRNELNKIH